MKTKTPYAASPMGVRLSAEDRQALARMAARLGIGPTTLVRLAMRVGLETLGSALREDRERILAVIDRLAAVTVGEE